MTGITTDMVAQCTITSIRMAPPATIRAVCTRTTSCTANRPADTIRTTRSPQWKETTTATTRTIRRSAIRSPAPHWSHPASNLPGAPPLGYTGPYAQYTPNASGSRVAYNPPSGWSAPGLGNGTSDLPLTSFQVFLACDYDFSADQSYMAVQLGA